MASAAVDTGVKDPVRAQILDLYYSEYHPECAELAHAWLAEHPQDFEILGILAECCLLCGYLDEAEKLYAFGQTKTPGAFYLCGLGAVAASRGDDDVAERYLRAAIADSPADPRSWMELSAVHRFRKDDPLFAKLRRQAKRTDISDQTRSILRYAMCKASNDMGKWDQAWRCAAEGARLDAPDFDAESFRLWMADLPGAFDRDLTAPRPGRGDHSDAPIFVVGPPRSGTTLAERLLCSTGEVVPLGEVPTINRLSSAAARNDYARGHADNRHGWVRRWRDDAFTEAAQFYMDDIRRRAGGTMPDRFVDKMPGNLIFLGQISMMFPNARIVRMHRDPLDNCVSLYLGRFRAGHTYTRRTDWLGAAWLGYRAAGDFLSSVIPNPVLDLSYEALVTDPEGESKRLFAFAGLDWSPAVLKGSGRSYTSLTRSKHQVRAAISNRAMGRWRRYRRQIGPLAEALGVDLAAASAAADKGLPCDLATRPRGADVPRA